MTIVEFAGTENVAAFPFFDILYLGEKTFWCADVIFKNIERKISLFDFF